MTDEAHTEPIPAQTAPVASGTPAPTPTPSASTPAAPSGDRRMGMGGRRFDNRRGQGGRGGGGRGGPGAGGRGRGRGPRPDAGGVESEYEEKNLEISRVTRVTKGGKRMRFRALTVIGNRKGRVGFGVSKGLDVAGATSKATAQARKALLTVPLSNETIPHQVYAKFAAAKVLLKPAPKGTGVKAGGAVRIVLELAGVPNVVSKVLGSKNKINNVKATFQALRLLKAPRTNK